MGVGNELDFCDEKTGLGLRDRTAYSQLEPDRASWANHQARQWAGRKALVHTLNNWLFQDLPNLIWQEATRRKGLP